MSFKGHDFEIIVDENLFNAETAADMLDLDQCLSLEILNYVSRKFKIEKIIRYEDPKHDTHRYGLYVCCNLFQSSDW